MSISYYNQELLTLAGQGRTSADQYADPPVSQKPMHVHFTLCKQQILTLGAGRSENKQFWMCYFGKHVFSNGRMLFLTVENLPCLDLWLPNTGLCTTNMSKYNEST